MNELVKIEINENQQQIVSARELYERLGVVKPFTQWFDDQVKRFGLQENVDFLTCRLESTGGRPSTDYIITLYIAKNIAMVSGGAKAQEIRDYLIEVEKAWNTPEKVMARALLMANQQLFGYRERVIQLEGDLSEAIRTKALISSRREATAMATASAAVKQRDKALDALGEGKNWKQARVIGWLKEYFDLGHKGFYSALGKALKAFSLANGYEVRNLEDTRYGQVCSFEVMAIEAFKRSLDEHPDTMAKYRLMQV